MSKRKYDLFGPLKIARTEYGHVDAGKLTEFWETANALSAGLSTASGCYIFGIRASKGIKPWYVGQATRGFKQECFTPDKLVKYNDVLCAIGKGTPVLFLLARRTPRGRFAKTLQNDEANWVERLLIHYCLHANDQLVNQHGTRFPKEVVIPGLINSHVGKPPKEVQQLRLMLSIK